MLLATAARTLENQKQLKITTKAVKLKLTVRVLRILSTLTTKFLTQVNYIWSNTSHLAQVFKQSCRRTKS